MTIKERREREKQNLKNEILNVAIKLAKRESWAEVSIRKISQEIEYSTIIIYNLFGNKDNLFFALKELGFKKLLSMYKRKKVGD